jgi:hypothetical protein
MAAPPQQLGKNKRSVVPTCKGPRRLAFRIRRRRFTFDGVPSLLIVDRFGVWSVGHRRYIRLTRYHRYCALKQDIERVRIEHAAVERWPEYVREVWPLRRRLDIFYWSLWPEERKREELLLCRQRRRRQRQQWRLVWFAAPFTWMAMLGFVLLRLLLLGRFSDGTNMCLLLAYLTAAYLLGMAWRASAL